MSELIQKEREIIWTLHLDRSTECCGAWVYSYSDGKEICSWCQKQVNENEKI